MINQKLTLALSIKALEVYGVPPYIIENMLSNLKKLVDKINKPKRAMTIEELKYMQSWTLDQKIDHSGRCCNVLSSQKLAEVTMCLFREVRIQPVLLDLVRRIC